MKRYFYTDPLAAAWMAKHHGMDIRLSEPDGKAFLETTLIHGLREWRDAISACADYKFYIHPDSLHLLEPKVGDLIWLKSFSAPQTLTEDDYLPVIAEHFTAIIQRNGVAFMWPESEDA